MNSALPLIGCAGCGATISKGKHGKKGQVKGRARAKNGQLLWVGEFRVGQKRFWLLAGDLKSRIRMGNIGIWKREKKVPLLDGEEWCGYG